MHISTYTMRFKIEGEADRLLYNPLTGAIDLVEPTLLRTLDEIKSGKPASLGGEVYQYFKKRGYIYDTVQDERDAVTRGYSAFADMDRETALRFFIVPTYKCNARCPYCFVHELVTEDPLITSDTISSAFRAMDQIREELAHNGTTQLIFFGGEPFASSPDQMDAVEMILRLADERGFLIDAVTNGLDLVEYLPMLTKYHFNKAQITLDGLDKVCNKRRPAVDERGKSFNRIVAGIDAGLAAGIQVNARILLDKKNIETLPDIVDFMDEKGWFDHPAFGSHVGSTYDCFDDLHKKERERYLNFYEGNEILVRLCREHPRIADKIKIDWHGARQFLNTGLLPPANYRSCLGATKTFAFDLHGDIFLCESTVGKQDCRIGTFLPSLEWDKPLMEWFRNRNVQNLEGCKSCNQALLCAGGCPFTGQVKGKDLKDLGCRGMKDTLEFGLNYYWPRIKERMMSSAEEDDKCSSGGCACEQ